MQHQFELAAYLLDYGTKVEAYICRFQAGSLYTGFQQPFGMVSGYHPVPDLAIRD